MCTNTADRSQRFYSGINVKIASSSTTQNIYRFLASDKYILTRIQTSFHSWRDPAIYVKAKLYEHISGVKTASFCANFHTIEYKGTLI